MNRFSDTEFTGAVTLDLAAAAADQPVRLGEFAATLSGKSNVGHTHSLDDILDEPAKFAIRLGEVLAPTPDLTWTVSGAIISGRARLKPAGGLVSTPAGLAVDFSGVMAVGSTITSAQISDFGIAFNVELKNQIADTQDIVWTRGAVLSGLLNLKTGGGILSSPTGLMLDGSVVMLIGDTITVAAISDFSTGFNTQLKVQIADTNTITWTRGAVLSGNAKLNPIGGVISDTFGIALDFGTGHNQVARGDHGHSQLHNPVTLTSGNSLAMTLAGQTLGGEVRLAPGSGMKITADGLMLDFGNGPTQPATGASVAVISGSGGTVFTVAGTPSITLGLSNSVLSATARIDGAPAAGFSKLAVSAGGMCAVLGVTSDTAAAGNHTHTIATTSADGFMSAADKVRLNNLAGSGAIGFVQTLYTREAAMLSGNYLMGHHDWDIEMTINRAIVRALTAPKIATTYRAEINGVIQSGTAITLLSGQTLAGATFTTDVPIGQVVRWVCCSGTNLGAAGLGIAIMMEVVPV